jgi:HPt (histidine-containing phosphotransfer) domain-containing protein
MVPHRLFRRRHPAADPGAAAPRTPPAPDPAPPAAAGAPTLPAALDPAAIERLRQLDPDGSRGFVVQVLRTYEASLERHLASLAPADGSPPTPADVARVAHTLKSSSASVGATTFAALCGAAERQAKAGDPSVLGATLDALRDGGAQALAAVRAMLPR